MDFSKDFVFRPSGYGVMDWASILEYCEQEVQPKWYVADHDCAYGGDIYEELKISLEYIRNQLQFCKKTS